MSRAQYVWALPTAFLAIVNIAGIWFCLVNQHVPEPYLDELFHVAQAQRYCQADYTWDSKITTPPGLYLISQLLAPIFGCRLFMLRALNLAALPLIYLSAYHIRNTLHNRWSPGKARAARSKTYQLVAIDSLPAVLDAHSALNIALFPPLFFFCALYYTDLLSTLLVLLSYQTFLNLDRHTTNVRMSSSLVISGLAALLFRQTNIFWVAVFPAGLAVVKVLKTKGLETRTTSNITDTRAILQRIWKHGLLYDCSVDDAGPADYVLFMYSAVVAVVKKPLPAFEAIKPYLVLLAFFGTFVLWNGGVVLGDKSAHVATIHIPQMLYFWLYIVFFSMPLATGRLFRPMSQFLPRQASLLSQRYLSVGSRSMSPFTISAFMFIVPGLVAVRYNTIVHPYSLADNRHYVFYAFRILRSYPVVKYLAVPVYYLCFWVAIQTLQCTPDNQVETKRDDKEDVSTSDGCERRPCQVSFIVLWLTVTSLSVVSAPLVEPRYFINSWVIWRLHVPHSQVPLFRKPSTSASSYDMRLILETLWLLGINTVIGYNFLFNGFKWPSEPNRVQRFLW